MTVDHLLLESTSGPGRRPGAVDTRLILRVVGAGLLVATGAIHLDLYLTGYRTIPTIGWLFLLQVISAFGLGTIVLVSGNWLVATAGAGFVVATLGGYLLSLRISLFGFREVRTTAGIVAGIVEVAAFAVLCAVALAPRAARQNLLRSPPAALVPVARWVASSIGVAAALLLALDLAASGPASTSSGSATALVKVAQVHGASVLTNARGYTLYWFAPDTSGKSTCYGTCATYWPPVIRVDQPSGPAGLPGRLGTVQRSGGARQVTYNGHPLYTYVGDSAPGQASGNKVNLNGGLWYEMTTSG